MRGRAVARPSCVYTVNYDDEDDVVGNDDDDGDEYYGNDVALQSSF